MDNRWPILYEDLLVVGNLESNVAICTLWTKRDKAALLLCPDQYCVIGNLYRTAGISPMIRNIFAHPQIRQLILWGDDLSGSGESLVAFWRNGVDDNGSIVGSSGGIETEIDLTAIDELRHSVQLIDLRGRGADELCKVIENLPTLPPFCKPRTFPMPEFKAPSVWSSEQFGFRVEGDLVARVWLKILRTIMRYGEVKSSRYGNNKALKEVVNLIAIVNAEDPTSVYYPAYLPMGRDALEEYYPQVLTAQNIPDTSYTYGDRLRSYNGFDQIASMIELIRTRPDSKRMYATTWKVDLDSGQTKSGDVPCLTQLNATVRDGTVVLTAHFRSQDMFSAWPLNMFAIRKLHKLICDDAQLELGPTMIVTHSAHIYAWDWEVARELLAKYRDELRSRQLVPDPRGYVIISNNRSYITVQGFSSNDDMLFEFQEKSARRLANLINSVDAFSSHSHILYIGREIQRAETALRLGIPYIQDRELLFEKLKEER